MSEQPINQWNMTTEPSDMMKINTPMPITVAPSPSNQMEVIDDDSFSYDGYQVVRGEFFAHICAKYLKRTLRNPLFSTSAIPAPPPALP